MDSTGADGVIYGDNDCPAQNAQQPDTTAEFYDGCIRQR